jgi:hypothetical protein
MNTEVGNTIELLGEIIFQAICDYQKLEGKKGNHNHDLFYTAKRLLFSDKQGSLADIFEHHSLNINLEYIRKMANLKDGWVDCVARQKLYG